MSTDSYTKSNMWWGLRPEPGRPSAIPNSKCYSLVVYQSLADGPLRKCIPDLLKELQRHELWRDLETAVRMRREHISEILLPYVGIAHWNEKQSYWKYMKPVDIEKQYPEDSNAIDYV